MTEGRGGGSKPASERARLCDPRGSVIHEAPAISKSRTSAGASVPSHLASAMEGAIPEP